MGITSDRGRGLRGPRVRLALAIGAVVLAGLVAALGAGPAVEAARAAAGSGGVLGAIGFAAAYAVLTVALVPGSLMTIAAGVLFGGVGGTLVTLAGATTGATLAFVLARRVAGTRFAPRPGSRLARLDVRLAGRGFTSVLVLRLVPIAPFNLLNYALGATSVRLRDYVAATGLGIVPASFSFAAAGAAAADPRVGTLSVVAAAVVVLVLGTAAVRRRARVRPAVAGGA